MEKDHSCSTGHMGLCFEIGIVLLNRPGSSEMLSPPTLGLLAIALAQTDVLRWDCERLWTSPLAFLGVASQLPLHCCNVAVQPRVAIE